MDAVLRSTAFVCLGAVFYSYALYPFVLVAIAGVVQALRDVGYVLRKGDRRENAGERLLPVAVVIAAYNEQVHLQQRIDNLLALDYPADLLDIYIGSDGSRDGTAAILQAANDPRVHGLVFEPM